MKSKTILITSWFLQVFLSLQIANYVDANYNPTGLLLLPILVVLLSLLILGFIAKFIEDKLLPPPYQHYWK